MTCRSTKAGHTVDPVRAERLMSTNECVLGFLRLSRTNPLIVWFDGTYEGHGFDRIYWSHEAEDLVSEIVNRMGEVPDPESTPHVPPLDPDVWVPTIAYKVLAKKTAPNFTPAVPVRIWRDELMSVSMEGGEPVLASIALIDDVSTCDRSDELGTCPNCGSGELKKVVMGYPMFDMVGNPNYELGGCVIDRRHPRGDLACASCGHEWRSSGRSA